MPMILSVQEHLISKFQHNLISYLAANTFANTFYYNSNKQLTFNF